MIFTIWFGIPITCVLFRNKKLKDGTKVVWIVIFLILLLLSFIK